MKFLVHSNAPNTKTGYGVQCAQLVTQLKAAGHEPAVSATYGCEGAIQTWNGIRIYPRGFDRQSNDMIHSHADHFFGEGGKGWIVTLLDVWAIENPILKEYDIAAWVPVDHFPCPPGVLDFFSRTQAIPVAMSKYGEQELFNAGLDPVYIPLSVDTSVYKPTPTLIHEGKEIRGRDLIHVPDDVFVVGMVAMNKGWAKDRKGFNEAFWAFGQFLKDHPDAVLYMHTEKFGGAEGQNLVELAVHAGIPDTNIVWADQYAYRVGYTAEMMAAAYTAMDVLLAPSHGEGFCVPLVEAQACGTPVIANDFSAQRELVGEGWLLREGQPEWDPAQHAAYVQPWIKDVLNTLEVAYQVDRAAMVEGAIRFAAQYDSRKIFAEYWLPFISSLEESEKVPELREPIGHDGAVAVLCPVRNRPQNIRPLVESFLANTPSGEATLTFIVEGTDVETIEAINGSLDVGIRSWATDKITFAEKVNVGVAQTTEPWIMCIGDDVRFHDGWLDAARKVSDRYDVIGTNDSTTGQGNPKVRTGGHADHFLIRRTYIDTEGSCLDGPGICAPEAYRHWYVDMEIIKLAKARGVFTPCLDSIVEHLHPGYRGDEAARQADSTYMEAVAAADKDLFTWKSRLPLIEMQRTTRSKA